MTKITHNTTHGADIVIERVLDEYVIWGMGRVIANTHTMGRDLIVAGASAHKLSVYDIEAGKFLAGTVDQLVREVEG